MLAADCGVTAETEEIDTVKDALVAFCEKRAASEVEGVTLSRDDWIEVASSCLSHNFAASLSVAGFVDFMLTTAAREAQAKAELEAQIADKDAEIADKDAEIADKDAEIAELKAMSQVSPTSRLEVPYLKPVRAKHFAGVVPTGSRWVASPELLLAPMLMGEVVMGLLSLGTSGTASLEVQHLDDIPDAWTGFVASGLRKANTIGSTVVCHELIKATLPLFRGLSNNHKVQSFYRGSVGVAALESSLTHRVCEGLGHVFANQQGTRAGFHSSSSQSTFSVASPVKTNPSHTDRARAKRTASSSSRSHEPQTSGLYSSAARMNIGREIAVSHGQGWDGVRPVDTQLSTKVDVLFTFEENEMVLPLGLWEPGFDPKSAQCPITMHKRKQAYGYAHNLTRASAGFPHTMALVALRSEYPTRANKALQVRTKMAVDGYVLQAEKCRALKAKATDDEPRLVPAVAYVTVAHFVSLFKTLQCMDNDGVAHLDIRDANLVFGADGKTHVIDWDLAGVSGEAVYPVGFNWVTDGMRVESVMDAVAKNETPTGYAWHDVVGAGGVMKLYSCDSKDNRTVWKKVTETLVNVDDASSARSALAVAIEELSSKENVRLWCLGREKTVLATDSPPLSPDGSPARAAVGSSSAESSPAGSSST
ncbi:uncharacterized protein AMSG_00477 [Thecamonas trahens ATCC 50062]|uniref:Protein kinase domain-containing protein n=1 Tax=Thecamonas trahens ATCC 50062 TaxID=461836 RepID=A0A0L0D8Z5_THETB|nr:hypothetical protein AMSG_00477 [Thecamonas trahens ATCC 50062]KNC48700.1 hypothetical protein AMSG_00477 [Thecamonas trahens ATCC 50062]|eukprot:XP_013762756.1 hypothetical protein AMSG_00477 [Thecamonas trahens ATCC 50062]